jgi:hypothetical protein
VEPHHNHWTAINNGAALRRRVHPAKVPHPDVSCVISGTLRGTVNYAGCMTAWMLQHRARKIPWSQSVQPGRAMEEAGSVGECPTT